MKRAYVDNVRAVNAAEYDWQLWFRWIYANTVGELIGLGVVAAVGAAFVLYIADSLGSLSRYAAAGLMIVVGAFEGIVVGYFQANVLGEKLRSLNRRSWITATAVGAGVAWALGAIPSLVMSVNSQDSSVQAGEPSELTVFSLAALMGCLLGIALAIPQWFVLRKYVRRAALWLPANALAWMIGMPQLFAGPSVIGQGMSAWQVAFVVFASIVSAGASVGAIHGLFLIWLLKGKQRTN